VTHFSWVSGNDDRVVASGKPKPIAVNLSIAYTQAHNHLISREVETEAAE